MKVSWKAKNSKYKSERLTPLTKLQGQEVSREEILNQDQVGSEATADNDNFGHENRILAP